MADSPSVGSQVASGVGNAASLGLFSSIAGIFGSTQEKRAAAEARRIINEARMEGITQSKRLGLQFDPFVDRSAQFLDEAATGIRGSQDYLQRIITQTEGLEVGAGLSSADKIAYEDAAKLLNEQMVSTGNLRSGAAAFSQAQLLRRVVADANERRFNRETAKLQLLFGGQQAKAAGANQFATLGGTAGQIGLYGKQLSSQLLQAAMGLAPAEATAELKKGTALSQQIGFAGSAADAAVQSGAKAYAGS